jgi:hypothetical protein
MAHHSVSAAALLGGGARYLRPGEVSLATTTPDPGLEPRNTDFRSPGSVTVGRLTMIVETDPFEAHRRRKEGEVR